MAPESSAMMAIKLTSIIEVLLYRLLFSLNFCIPFIQKVQPYH